jgi:hypothetical protein
MTTLCDLLPTSFCSTDYWELVNAQKHCDAFSCLHPV